MRHRVGQRKLGRVTEHRIAMLRNQAVALLRYERIETTVPRAKELRPFVERLITIAKRGLDAGDGNPGGRVLHARRLVLRDIHDPIVVGKLFDTLAPRFATRPGGYTRLLRVGFRRGDSAAVAQVELVGSEYNPKAKDQDKAARPSPSRRQVLAGGCVRRPSGFAARKTRAASASRSHRPRRRPARGPRAARSRRAARVPRPPHPRERLWRPR